jgi:hypothetical protein
MRYVEAPAEYYGDEMSVFLAGGITDCENWQQAIVAELSGTCLTVINPRRRLYPSGDPSTEEEQVAWEFRHLRHATAVLFWFLPPTLNPIALYELGMLAGTRRPLFVGVDVNYPRGRDIQLQLKFARPDVRIQSSLSRLGDSVREWSGERAAGESART